MVIMIGDGAIILATDKKSLFGRRNGLRAVVVKQSSKLVGYANNEVSMC